MTLLDEIHTAQRDAGEAAVIANLQRQGLIPSEPPPMYPQGIINQLEGEAKVLRALLAECASVIYTIEGEDSLESEKLSKLHLACIEALKVTP